jgi:hypothetical protein
MSPCTHCFGTGEEPAPMPLLLSCELEIRTVSEANQRNKWQQAKRKAAQREAVKAWLEGRHHHHERLLLGGAVPLEVTMTRIAPSSRGLDDDNLASAFKAIRDEIAAWLKVDDRDPRVKFTPAQEKGAPKRYAVRIEIRQRRALKP